MRACDLRRDVQSQAQPLLGRLLFVTRKRLKKAGDGCLRNRVSAVADGEHEVLVVTVAADSHGPRNTTVDQSVGEEIGEKLRQTAGIAINLIGQVEFDYNTPRRSGRLQLFDDLGEDRPESDRSTRKGHSVAKPASGEVHDIVDKGGHS